MNRMNEETIDNLSTYYHLQYFFFNGIEFVLDSHNRKNFLVYESSGEERDLGTITADSDEELREKTSALVKKMKHDKFSTDRCWSEEWRDLFEAESMVKSDNLSSHHRQGGF